MPFGQGPQYLAHFGKILRWNHPKSGCKTGMFHPKTGWFLVENGAKPGRFRAEIRPFPVPLWITLWITRTVSGPQEAARSIVRKPFCFAGSRISSGGRGRISGLVALFVGWFFRPRLRCSLIGARPAPPRKPCRSWSAGAGGWSCLCRCQVPPPSPPKPVKAPLRLRRGGDRGRFKASVLSVPVSPGPYLRPLSPPLRPPAFLLPFVCRGPVGWRLRGAGRRLAFRVSAPLVLPVSLFRGLCGLVPASLFVGWLRFAPSRGCAAAPPPSAFGGCDERRGQGGCAAYLPPVASVSDRLLGLPSPTLLSVPRRSRVSGALPPVAGPTFPIAPLR